MVVVVLEQLCVGAKYVCHNNPNQFLLNVSPLQHHLSPIPSHPPPPLNCLYSPFPTISPLPSFPSQPGTFLYLTPAP